VDFHRPLNTVRSYSIYEVPAFDKVYALQEKACKESSLFDCDFFFDANPSQPMLLPQYLIYLKRCRRRLHMLDDEAVHVPESRNDHRQHISTAHNDARSRMRNREALLPDWVAMSR